MEDLLKRIGLSDKEIQIYLTLLQQGQLTPAQLSRRTKINRTTIYSVAHALIEKGLLSEDMTAKGNPLYALPPQHLNTLMSRQERDLNQKKELTKRAVLELNNLVGNLEYSIPRITFITETELNDFLYEQTNKWCTSIMKYDKTMWGFSSTAYVEAYLHYMNWFWEQAPKDLELKMLGEDTKVEKSLSDKYPKRQIKVAKPKINFTTSTVLCGDYILLVNTNKKPFYLIEIYDSALAHNMREMYKRIWDSIQ